VLLAHALYGMNTTVADVCFAHCDFNFNLHEDHEEASVSFHRRFLPQPTANVMLLKQRPIQNHSAVEDFQPLQI